MALLTISKELALTEAGNSVLMSSVFHRLAGNFGFCVCVLHVTRHSTLSQLALVRKRRMVIVSAEFGGKQNHVKLGPGLVN